MLRRLNEIVLALLFHASLPPSFWVEALYTATYLHNILPSSLLDFRSPSSLLYLKHPTYDHLRVFGCACYPNLSATPTHKLQRRSTKCVFLGYPPNYRGYRCLDLHTGKVIISRHVTFDENVFPFASPPTSQYSFLEPDQTPLSPIFYDHIASPSTTVQATPTPPPKTPIRVYTRRTQTSSPASVHPQHNRLQPLQLLLPSLQTPPGLAHQLLHLLFTIP